MRSAEHAPDPATDPIADPTMEEARAAYWAANDFGEDGGYSKKWERIDVGPLPVWIPNLPSRVEAIRFHDMHHVLTGYQTDLKGEFEISAWEIGAGCGRLWFAWAINLQGMAAGLLRFPGHTVRAFYRGRHSVALYHLPFEGLLESRVSQLRERTRVEAASLEPAAGDRAALLFWGVVAFVWTLGPLVAMAAGVWGAWRLLAG